MAYELFCQSVRGASHIRKEMPRQDCGIKKDCGKYRIFAAADGHGDVRCFRSDVGSECICRIAAQDLETFAHAIEEQGWEEKLLAGRGAGNADEENEETEETEAKRLVRQLANSMVGKWLEEVSGELEKNPLTEEERKRAPASAKEYDAGIRTERMYGTTLIAGLQTEKYLLLIQQGDGRCVVFDDRGDAFQPIPWDEQCVGTATTSLCDSDAAQSFRHCIIDLERNPVIACIAGTDGVEDSFPASMERTHAYYRGLLRYACENGVQALEEHLAGALQELSANGSADDITVSGIIAVERVKPFLNAFAEKDVQVKLEEEAAFYEGKVRSILEGGRLQHLEKKYRDAAYGRETAEWLCREAKSKYDEAVQKYQNAETQYQNAEKQYQNANTQYQNAETQYQNAETQYQSIKQQWREVASQLQLVGRKPSRVKRILDQLSKENDTIGKRVFDLYVAYQDASKKKTSEKGKKDCAEKQWNDAREKSTRTKNEADIAKNAMDSAKSEWDAAGAEQREARDAEKAAKDEYQSYQEKLDEATRNRNAAKEALEAARKRHL